MKPLGIPWLRDHLDPPGDRFKLFSRFELGELDGSEAKLVERTLAIFADSGDMTSTNQW